MAPAPPRSLRSGSVHAPKLHLSSFPRDRRDAMCPGVITCDPGSRLAVVAATMASNAFHGAVILGPGQSAGACRQRPRSDPRGPERRHRADRRGNRPRTDGDDRIVGAARGGRRADGRARSGAPARRRGGGGLARRRPVELRRGLRAGRPGPGADAHDPARTGAPARERDHPVGDDRRRCHAPRGRRVLARHAGGRGGAHDGRRADAWHRGGRHGCRRDGDEHLFGGS